VNNKVLVVVGPTAVGKTALAIELAKRCHGQIISGDSQQVYKGLDIGTAKATKEEQEQAVHHLIDVRELNENFSAYDFVEQANEKIKLLLEQGQTPIIVGGTGLYIQSLIEGYHLGGQGNHDQMMRLRESLEKFSDDELIEQLEQKNIHIPEFNRRRAMRTLELKKFGQGENKKSPYEFMLIGLDAEREMLYERINERVDRMIEQGLPDEGKMLYEQYPEVQATKAIGYKELFPYFSGENSLEEAIKLIKRNSRRYAKRQGTWFKNRMNVKFYNVLKADYPKNVILEVESFLKE